MTAEQEVDFAAIRVGDKVKLRYHGLESTDWHEVIKLHADGIQVSGGWRISRREQDTPGGAAIIAHQRKVEVTLGEPLGTTDRFYAGWLFARRAQNGPGVDIAVEGRVLSHLTPPEARRLVRDILATVGVDD